MQKFDLLNENLLFGLNLKEREELKQYLLTLPLRDCLNFIMLSVDCHFTLSDNNSRSRRIKNFFSDIRFDPYRTILMKDIVDDGLTDLEWKEVESEFKRYQRKIKLATLDGKIVSEKWVVFPEFAEKDRIKIAQEEANRIKKSNNPKKDMNYFQRKNS